MASYSVNEAGVAQARRLIDVRQYVLRSEWGDVQPAADEGHRSRLIACQYRAAEWRHKAIELAAHDLLQHLDKTSA
jgi:hypothetical protein